MSPVARRDGLTDDGLPDLVGEAVVLRGDPWRLEVEARELASVGDRITGVTGMLGTLWTRGVWDSCAGNAFADKIGTVPQVLDQLVERMDAAGEELRTYAGRLRTAQVAIRRTHREIDGTDEALEREAKLAVLRPDDAAVGARSEEHWRTRTRLVQELARLTDDAVADEEQVRGRLAEIIEPAADPGLYSFLGSADRWGGRVALVPHPGTAVAGAVTQATGVAGRRAVYGEGSYAAALAAGGTSAAGLLGKGLNRGGRLLARTGPGRRVVAHLPGAGRASAAAPVAATRARADALRAPQAGGRRSWGEAVRRRARAKVEDESGVTLAREIQQDWAAVAGGGRAAEGMVVAGSGVKVGLKVHDRVSGAQRSAERVRQLQGEPTARERLEHERRERQGRAAQLRQG